MESTRGNWRYAMVTFPAGAEKAVGVAVFARAPAVGAVKTRLIPRLGAVRAARLQRLLTRHALATACTADIGGVALWGAPDGSHRFFRALQRRVGVALHSQSGDDLGARMAAAFATSAGPLLLIGADCPALQATHLVAAAGALLGERGGGKHDAVLIPAEDGGYVLVGLNLPQPRLFENIDWGSDRVMVQTRQRLVESGLSWVELPVLWDVDRPVDLERLATLEGFDAWQS